MLGSGRGVPVRAVPLINGCSACRALLRVRHVARRARDVVIRDNGWTHWLKRPIGGVAPARGSGGQESRRRWRREGASTEKCRGRGEEEEESKKQTSANLKKWGMTGGEHRTSGLAGGNPQVSSGAESGRKLLSAKNHTC